jgi:hypothetical protein
MMANPDVRSTPMMDLYLSPQSYDPGSPMRVEGTRLPLKQSEEKTVDGVRFQLRAIVMDRSELNANPPRVTLNAKMLVTPPGGKPQDQTAKMVITMGANEQSDSSAPDAAIPGTAGRYRILRAVGADSLEIEVLGLNPAGDVKPPTTESFSVDVTTKPLISLVWGGFYVMMAGGFVALLRRGRDARAASMA